MSVNLGSIIILIIGSIVYRYLCVCVCLTDMECPELLPVFLLTQNSCLM